MIASEMNNGELVRTMSSVPIGVFLNFIILLIWKIVPRFLRGIERHSLKALTLLIISLVIWALLAIGIIAIIHALVNKQVNMRYVSLVAVVVQFILLIPTIMLGTSVGMLKSIESLFNDLKTFLKSQRLVKKGG